MCGRLSQYDGNHDFVAALSMPNALVNNTGDQPFERYNAVPTTQLALFHQEGNYLHADMVRCWGWRPHWAKDRAAPINARVEKVAHGYRQGTSDDRKITLPKWDGISRVLTSTEKKRARAAAKEHWNGLTREQQLEKQSAAYDAHCKTLYKKDPSSLSRQLLSTRPGLSDEYEDWKIRNGVPSQEEMRRFQREKRQTAQARSTPAWNREFDQFVWREMKLLRADREKATGIRWAIDHVIPIQGRRVSGLHTAANWQLIPHWMNNEKLNRLVLTQPDEWIRFINHEWLPSDLFRQNSRSSPYYDPYSVDH